MVVTRRTKLGTMKVFRTRLKKAILTSFYWCQVHQEIVGHTRPTVSDQSSLAGAQGRVQWQRDGSCGNNSSEITAALAAAKELT